MRFRYQPARQRARIRASMRQSSLSTRFLQGLFVLAIGAVIIAVNFSSALSPFQKVSGHITNEYQETVTASGAYTASDLVIDSSSDIFIFNKNDFSPTWNDNITKGQRIDIYYQDGTPKKVVAMTLYDPFDGHATTYSTPDYANKNSPTFSFGLIAGIIIALLGYLWLMQTLWLFVRLRLQQRASKQVTGGASGS